MVQLRTGIYKVREGLFKVQWSDFEDISYIYSEKGVYKINSVNEVQRENLAAPHSIPVTKCVRNFSVQVFLVLR